MNKYYTKALPTTFAQAKLFNSCLYVITETEKRNGLFVHIHALNYFLLFLYKSGIQRKQFFICNQPRKNLKPPEPKWVQRISSNQKEGYMEN